jgi:hypothetical protein
MAFDVTRTLRQALSALETQKTRLDRQITALKSMLTGASGNGSMAAAPRRRRGMNAAQRRAVSQRMKAYWASRKAGKARGKKAEKAS